MARVAIIADNRTVGVFAALGFDAFHVQGAEEASEALDKVSGGQYGLVYITEGIAMGLSTKIESMRKRPVPVIGIIPGPEGSLGSGLKRLKASVEKAMGADILFKGEEG